jgi:hypothetical protein
VLGFKNAIHKKYNNYDHTLIDFNAYVEAATPSPKLVLADCGERNPIRVVRLILGRMW